MNKEIIASPQPSKPSIIIGEDGAENVMKNVIMMFQCNPVTDFQDTSTYQTLTKNFNLKNF